MFFLVPRNKQRKYHKVSNKSNRDQEIDSDSVIVRAFQQFGKELDGKNDKYERLVKISRDITIESKRIIFGLQGLCRSLDIKSDSKKLQEGLKKIMSTHFRSIAAELDGEDHYQFLRAYTPGIQEFIEALTLYNYLIKESLYTWDQLKNDLCFTVNKPIEELNEPNDTLKTSLTTTVSALDYVLGVEDLSGELMRLCINSFAAGKLDSGFATCNFVKSLYEGMLRLSPPNAKEFHRKLYVFKQSLVKMETACYMMHVRGSEILTHMLPEVVEERQEEYESGGDFF
ncbi:hypothetical protein AAG570_000736 [Ranatra chinensis]|uniref:Translin-associated protein X n=1 Tax=Ranatra chinensis TaxID=642074 RepID=A0ABD0YXX0_9HEMI